MQPKEIMDLLNGLRVQLNRMNTDKFEKALANTADGRKEMEAAILELVTVIEEVDWKG